MAKRVVANSFVIVHCPDPKCGLHFIGLDKNDKAICELVITHENGLAVLTEIMSMIEPDGRVN